MKIKLHRLGFLNESKEENLINEYYQNDVCVWYDRPERNSELDTFIRERTANPIYSHYWCSDNEQIICTEYIQCVRLEEIEEREPWQPGRTKEIKEWADPDTLRRIRYFRDERGEQCLWEWVRLPRVGRDYVLGAKKQEKFRISDGIHRIHRARELGMDCTLCKVSECVKVDKEKDKREYK